MAERQLGGGRLGGKLKPYVPRGAQYDYNPPSVYARYKILTAVFVILLVSLFGIWAIVARKPRAAVPTPQPIIYVEPLAPP